MIKKETIQTVDEYISLFSSDVQDILKSMRKVIKRSAPDAVEGIAYQMPGYKLNGKPLVYFAACKQHIGFYPTPSGVNFFEKELSEYPCSKGSIQFPFDQPLPFDLVKKIVLYRVKENLAKK